MMTPLPVDPDWSGIKSPAQPYAPFLASLDAATRSVTAARNILTGPQLMHQTVGQGIQSSIAQAYTGLVALNTAVSQPASSDAMRAALIGRAALSNVISLSLRANSGPVSTPILVNAYNVALNAIHDARSMATVYFTS
jgi:hypothetical protein